MHPIEGRDFSVSLRPSWLLTFTQVSVALLASAGLMLLPLTPFQKLVFGWALLTCLVHSLYRDAFQRSADSVTRIGCHHGQWFIERGHRPVLREFCTLIPGYRLQSWIVMLEVRSASGRRLPVVILPDSLTAGQFRLLRVALMLWGQNFEPGLTDRFAKWIKEQLNHSSGAQG
ncbi:MAG: hypothetical protein KDI36_11815 [Pseudomonadales bacterium]|nr:hypothetical protein [Pseudomonadales bacterium]